MHKRLTTVTRNAFGDRTSVADARCHRTNASCKTSSASATVPSILYAIEKSSRRCGSNAASRSDASRGSADDEVRSSGSVFIAFFEEHVRNAEQTEERQRIDHIQDAEVRR